MLLQPRQCRSRAGERVGDALGIAGYLLALRGVELADDAVPAVQRLRQADKPGGVGEEAHWNALECERQGRAKGHYANRAGEACG